MPKQASPPKPVAGDRFYLAQNGETREMEEISCPEPKCKKPECQNNRLICTYANEDSTLQTKPREERQRRLIVLPVTPELLQRIERWHGGTVR